MRKIRPSTQLASKSSSQSIPTSGFGTLLRLLASGNGALVAASLATTLALSQCPAALAGLSRTIIDDLTVLRAHPTPSVSQTILMLGIAYLAVSIAQGTGYSVLSFVSERLQQSASRNVHTALMKASLRLEGIRLFDNPEFHNRRAMIEGYAFYMPMNCFRLLTDLISIVLTVAGMACLLVRLEPLIPVILLAFTLPEVRTQIKAHRLAYEGIKETAYPERVRGYYLSVLLSRGCAKEVRVYGLQKFFIDRYRDSTKLLLDILTPIRRMAAREAFKGRLVSSMGTALPYLWAVQRAATGHMSPGNVVMFMTAVVVVQQQLSRAAQTIAGHQEVFERVKDFAEWIDMDTDLEKRPTHALPGPHSEPREVTIENVWFKYPSGSGFVLKGLSLTIPKGTSLAIVGRNGCGKSTLVKLLCRMYDPEAGIISFDDTDVRDLDVRDVRRSQAVIFQDFMQYLMTLRDNIAFGRSGAFSEDLALQNAACRSGVDEISERLPRQFDTFLGREFGDAASVDLSGGQWQRVALARAFYRDSGFLILDEPAASLDVATEAKIYAQFKAMTRDRTALLISHRLATVSLADRIAVIDDGRVVEYGDHRTLMSLGGLYAEMFETQAERYRQNGNNNGH